MTCDYKNYGLKRGSIKLEQIRKFLNNNVNNHQLIGNNESKGDRNAKRDKIPTTTAMIHAKIHLYVIVDNFEYFQFKSEKNKIHGTLSVKQNIVQKITIATTKTIESETRKAWGSQKGEEEYEKWQVTTSRSYC